MANPRPTNGRNTPGAQGIMHFGDGVWLITKAGVPTDGTSGTGVGYAGPGSLVVDYTNAKLYINTGTAASPAYTVVGAQTA